MNKLSSVIVNHELSKINLKLSKVEELEKIYERERKHLAKQQQEVFIDRIALAKSTLNITKKLDDVISMIQNSDGNSNPNSEKISNILVEAKSLLYKPTRHSLIQISSDLVNGEKNDQPKVETKVDEEYKPLSLQTPQTFKVWAP
jgi:hypothetical protein